MFCSLNLLATRAFYNVKLEPVEVTVAEKYGQDYLSSMEKRFEFLNKRFLTKIFYGFFGLSKLSYILLMFFLLFLCICICRQKMTDNIVDEHLHSSKSGSPEFQEPELNYNSELSPQAFAKQLRHNDSASMVVCRSHSGKPSLG